jgi:16S rRNA (uracil1498-N3)-methyltransferase
MALGAALLPVLAAWKARPGEIVTAVDPEGACWRLRLTDLGKEPRGVPFARLARPMESRVAIEVYQALPDKERFELVLQKLTELGVTRVVPVETRRSLTHEERDAGQAKSHRWPEVILRAVRQCRRPLIPELFAPCALADALSLAAPAELKLMLYEEEESWTLGDALGRSKPERVALLVGPEGGFDPEEVAAARAEGFLPIALGPRILRTETAALTGAALLQGLLGDLC